MEFNGLRVPEVLLSGNHEEVELWRTVESIKRTALRRPDLFVKRDFSKQEKIALIKIIREMNIGAE